MKEVKNFLMVPNSSGHYKKREGKIGSIGKQEWSFTKTGRNTQEILIKTHFPGSKTLDLNGNSGDQDPTKHTVRD